MPTPIKCDGCGTVGVHALKYQCPDGWFYIPSIDEGGQGTYYVFACSWACATKMWKPGPGPELMAPEPAKCTCAHGDYEHGNAGCFHKNGHDIYCSCSWVPPPRVRALACDHASEVPTGRCICGPDCYCRGRTCSR